MTLPENMNKENTNDARRLKTLTAALTISLRQALRRKGISSGMTACGELLQKDPGSVMLCVLPTNGGVAAHIHHTLIEAFCHENGIAILMVDSEEKLAKLIVKMEKKVLRGDSRPIEDASCVLVKYPKKDLSKQNKTLLDFHHEMNWKHYPMPVLTLPD